MKRNAWNQYPRANPDRGNVAPSDGLVAMVAAYFQSSATSSTRYVSGAMSDDIGVAPEVVSYTIRTTLYDDDNQNGGLLHLFLLRLVYGPAPPSTAVSKDVFALFG
jgi:hypothetical protein